MLLKMQFREIGASSQQMTDNGSAGE
ncbi:MAG: hypothetical protein JWR44_328, partial [Hymenobacter sp.]|nr:hypothetical protein [Hymenobacter sp.]